MQLQPFKYSDIASLSTLQPEGWPDIYPHFQFYTDAEFCHPVKVMHGNEIIGIGASILHQDVAWLAHIIVHPDYRKKGLGQFITKKLVDLAFSFHCTTIYLIATDLGKPVYEKVGFETDTEYIFIKDIRTESSQPLGQCLMPYNHMYCEQVMALDKKVSGENRYCQIAPHLNKNSLLFVEQHQVKGYYLSALGEGHILAAMPEAGIELLKARLREKNFCVLPKINTHAIDFLQSQGGTIHKTASRMLLGIKRKWMPTCVYSRIGGNLG